MDIIVKYAQSAFKHGVSEAGIEWAIETRRYDRLLDGFENKYLLLGFNNAGNLLEIMYNKLETGGIRVFHAMKCRKSFIPLIN
jgi:hypothetical protein